MAARNSDYLLIQVLSIAYAALAVATVAVVLYDEAEDSEGGSINMLKDMVSTVQIQVEAFRRVKKRLHSGDSDGDSATANKRKKVEYDYEGARACIYRDYLGDWKKHFETGISLLKYACNCPFHPFGVKTASLISISPIIGSKL